MTTTKLSPTRRTALPQRRLSENIEFEHEGVDNVATFTRDADGKLAEVFLRAGKPGSQADKVAQDSAINTCYRTTAQPIVRDLDVLEEGCTYSAGSPYSFSI